jgi:hypothetical protein
MPRCKLYNGLLQKLLNIPVENREAARRVFESSCSAAYAEQAFARTA